MIEYRFLNKNETQIWDLMRKGNREALEHIYRLYVKNLYNYGRKICEDKEVVEDAIHDLFVDLWRYRKNISAITSVRYYLYLSLRRKIIKTENKRSLSVSGPVNWEEISNLMTPPADYTLVNRETLDERTRRLKKYLGNLSPRQYEAIVLRFYDDFSYEEIGTLMNLNTQSARNLVQRGLSQLRQYAQLLISWGAMVSLLLLKAFL